AHLRGDAFVSKRHKPHPGGSLRLPITDIRIRRSPLPLQCKSNRTTCPHICGVTWLEVSCRPAFRCSLERSLIDRKAALARWLTEALLCGLSLAARVRKVHPEGFESDLWALRA